MSIATQPLLDRYGKTVAECNAALESEFGPTKHWPFPERLELNARNFSQAMRAYHAEWDDGGCWACERRYDPADFESRLQVHHLGHAYQRCDCRACLMCLCACCHRKVAGNLDKLLWCKIKRDPEYTDWTHLALALRRLLPEPQSPPSGGYWRPGFWHG